MNIEEFNNAIKSKTFAGYELKEDKDSYGNASAWIILNDKKDIEAVANAVKAYKGRCIVATAYKNHSGTHTVIYHFDIEGLIINVQLETDDQSIVSITPTLPSANWAEREIREMYGVEPIGHPDKDRLFLDYSLAKGVLNEYISLSKMQLGVSETDILWENVNKEIKQ
ncbi:NADH-quinone oxidoreductase subunit C [Sulfurovum sp. ST-21]|uniref:NADH-quinone oxidoreductase subunit C n=1 Tax=Sulfurovum indicum TaxID=2779528 RepID=A0A7M1S0Z7_9BACT|nr:NADH-quinone oxidoreductase subunit C [Sulfurovum indicum]QOR61153.1 NADH-quinone oxidoreductase subunit C [Sulfurovum indicum]